MAISFGQKLWNQEVSALLRITEEEEERAWRVFQQYADKGFSFTDCTSFALMERLDINTVFAFDDHLSNMENFLSCDCKQFFSPFCITTSVRQAFLDRLLNLALLS